MTDQDDPFVFFRGGSHNVRGGIGRGVVHHDDVSDIVRDLLENGLDLPLHAVTGEDNGDVIFLKIGGGVH